MLCSSTVPVCRGAYGPGGYDEHLDSAERHSSGNRDQEGLSAAAETGQVPENGSAL